MSTKSLAFGGLALVFPILGALGWALALSERAKADCRSSARCSESKQGPALAASAPIEGTGDREPPSDHAPTVGETYPFDRTQSPLTPAVVARLRELATHNARLLPDMFAKLGASATVNRNFMRCFAGDHVELDGRTHLRETIAHFNGADASAGWRNPFRRRSLCATVGWTAGQAVSGDPSPLAEELRASDARFALVMYGSNDIELGRPVLYAKRMLRLTRMLTVRGVIPLLSTIMPRDDDPDSDRVVSLYNAVVRGIAQGRRLPMIDLHRELSRLPDHGLAQDHLHPRVHFEDGNPRGCVFTPEGLRNGYNVRNLITMEALDRLRRTVLEGEAPPDVPAPLPRGQGTLDDPIRIARLPFSHMADTRHAGHRLLDRYEECGPQNESGPELVYRLHLEEPAQVRAMVIVAGGRAADLDLHHLQLGPEGPRCVTRADETVESTLAPGDHYFVVDTFAERAGRYLFVIARTDLPSSG